MYGRIKIWSTMYGRIQIWSTMYGRIQIWSTMFGRIQIQSKIDPIRNTCFTSYEPLVLMDRRDR
jgi:hypothetical protein